MRDLVKLLVEQLNAQSLMLATAESCTGGGLAAAITDLPGVSRVFDRGFVTYSNDAKIELLGVPRAVLEAQGAVSAETAAAMVEGALAHSHAEVAISITGIAGPDGGTPAKPVGLVYVAWGKTRDIQTARCHFQGDRAAIRRQAIETALQETIRFLGR